MRSWRYYRNLFLLYLTLILMIVAAARALTKPVYWVLTLLLWLLYRVVRQAFSYAHPGLQFSGIQEDDSDFREVAFQGAGGLRLYGRFMPSHNRATVILAHGLGACGRDLLLLARLLVREGFGVFLIDLRAHGRSEGDTSTFGWMEGEDVACAVEFLLGRIDVHGEKIAAYGFSLGAQAVLRGALRTERLRALVLEGLGPSTLADQPAPGNLGQWLNLPLDWLYYAVYRLMIGGKDRGVLEVLKALPPRPLFFISSGEREARFSRRCYQAAREPKLSWEVPAAPHGGALVQEPNEYVDRIVRFLNDSLNVGAGSP